MWVCSAINKESKPRSSIALARAPGAIPSSVTNVEIPNFMASLNHTERVSEGDYNPSTVNRSNARVPSVMDGDRPASSRIDIAATSDHLLNGG
jgi:hypothetical protein